MSSEVSRLIRLTTNLLYMAGADAGRAPERRPLELDVVCLEVLRQGRDLRHGVKLIIGREDQVTVLGDRDQIKQMVLNLVENALKYTPDGGQVTLSVYKNGSDAHVRVEDTGPGIPHDILPSIFQRFYRGNQRGMMGGTGLGLAIAEGSPAPTVELSMSRVKRAKAAYSRSDCLLMAGRSRNLEGCYWTGLVGSKSDACTWPTSVASSAIVPVCTAGVSGGISRWM
jgi:K+-sensing histidine kinase KdpD